MPNNNTALLIGLLLVVLTVGAPVAQAYQTQTTAAQLQTEQASSVSFDDVTSSFVIGESIQISGTTSGSVDEVAIYVRDDGKYKLAEIKGVSTIEVSDIGEFSETDVDLLRGAYAGSEILRQPGEYQLGAIASTDADINGDGKPDTNLTSTTFNEATSTSTPIEVNRPSLSGSIETIRGEIAIRDSEVNIQGEARGQDAIVVTFVGSNGNAVAEAIAVDSDGTFEVDGIPLFDSGSFGEDDINLIGGLDKGPVSAHIISPGLDGYYGNDNYPGSDFLTVAIEDDLASNATTGDQLRSQINSTTIEASGSDDQMVSDTFQLTDGYTTISKVYLEGGTPSDTDVISPRESIVVEGVTNRKPDDNVIDIDVLNVSGGEVTIPEDGTSMYSYNYSLPESDNYTTGTAVGAGQWETDGEWQVTLNTSSLEPGTYTIESDDGDNTDQAEIEIGDSQTSPVEDYANQEGTVETGGLLQAINDWRDGGANVSTLLEVINAWRSGNSVV
jgi:major cell surface glycoprotein (TIGR04216 family)